MPPAESSDRAPVPAHREVLRTGPDVVVMDLHMPGTNGVDATRAILRAAPGTRVLVLTMFSDDESVFAAYFSAAPTTAVRSAQPFPELTVREREVLDLITAGRPNTAIARTLVISPRR